MVDNVTVISPDAGIVRVKHDLDGGFRRNQDCIAFRASDLLPVDLGDFENMLVQMRGVGHSTFVRVD